MTGDNLLETVVSAAKQIETILETKFGARGRGLYEKALSIREFLGDGLVSRLADHTAVLKKDGEMFGLMDAVFTCQREVPDGCAHWSDGGAAYIAASKVSYSNVLKIGHLGF